MRLMTCEPYFLRKFNSAKIRLRNQVQHWVLSALSKTPAPWRFALRNFLFKYVTRLFISSNAFTQWQVAVNYFDLERPAKIKIIDLREIPVPHSLAPKKIAIQAHIFYPDLAPELAKLLAYFPVPFDLLISTPYLENTKLLSSQFNGISNLRNLQILITPNRGRDLGPLLYGFGTQLLNYDYFAHVHTKKSSASNNIGDSWRKYLFNNLLNPEDNRVVKILNLLDKFGLVYPQKFDLIDVVNCQWANNYKAALDLCASINISVPTPGYIEFPVGSMFWANTAALKPLLEYPFTLESFEIEKGQTDQTIMHVLERSLSHIAMTQGYQIGLLSLPRKMIFYP